MAKPTTNLPYIRPLPALPSQSNSTVQPEKEKDILHSIIQKNSSSSSSSPRKSSKATSDQSKNFNDAQILAELDDLTSNYNPNRIQFSDSKNLDQSSSEEEIEAALSLMIGESKKLEKSSSQEDLNNVTVDVHKSKFTLGSAREEDSKAIGKNSKKIHAFRKRNQQQQREHSISGSPKPMSFAKSPKVPFTGIVPKFRSSRSTRSGAHRTKGRDTATLPPDHLIHPSSSLIPGHSHDGVEFDQTLPPSPLTVPTTAARPDSELLAGNSQNKLNDQFPDDQGDFLERDEEFFLDEPPTPATTTSEKTGLDKLRRKDTLENLDEELTMLMRSDAASRLDLSDPHMQGTIEDQLAAIDIEASSLIRAIRDPKTVLATRDPKAPKLMRQTARTGVPSLSEKRAQAIDTLIKSNPAPERNAIRALNIFYCALGNNNILSAIEYPETAVYAQSLTNLPEQKRLKDLNILFNTLKHYFSGTDRSLADHVQRHLDMIEGANKFRKSFEIQGFAFWLRTQIVPE